MTPDLLLWVVARASGIGSLAALCLALVSGIALRTSIFTWAGTSREVRALHDFTNLLWIPLGLVHLGALLLDSTAQLRPQDAVLPFQVPYGTDLIGLGTLSLDLLVVVALAAWLRRRPPRLLWRWLHRLAYPACALALLHAALGGTDFANPLISALAFAAAAAAAVLVLARVLFGRLGA